MSGPITAERILADVQEIDAICTANELVVAVDPVMERLVFDALGASNPDARYVHVEHRAVDAEGNEVRPVARDFAPSRQVLRHGLWAECSRCWDPMNPLRFEEVLGRFLPVPMGRRVASFFLCLGCQYQLDEMVDGLVWW